MSSNLQSFCFCTLALGRRYRVMTQELAGDLQRYAPGIKLVVGTDKIADFAEWDNIIPFELHQQGILHCYHDKRFAIAKSLSLFETAILIDADTRIGGEIPGLIQVKPGVIGAFQEDLLTHVQKYTPERLSKLQQVAAKLSLDLKQAVFVGEALIIISRHQGKEAEFIHWWGKIGTYLELRGIYAGSGNIIGLAAAKSGFLVERTADWEAINQVKQHLDASHQKKNKSWLERWQKRLLYHYRLNKTRLLALQDASFYYR